MEKCNECIRCTVDNCTLETIQVGTHEANPTMDQCTDCLSYTKR